MDGIVRGDAVAVAGLAGPAASSPGRGMASLPVLFAHYSVAGWCLLLLPPGSSAAALGTLPLLPDPCVGRPAALRQMWQSRPVGGAAFRFLRRNGVSKKVSQMRQKRLGWRKAQGKGRPRASALQDTCCFPERRTFRVSWAVRFSLAGIRQYALRICV